MAKVTRLSLDGGGGLERKRLHLREISDDADMPLETLGQDLRKARQRKGEDLAGIARILKIHKAYLEALEESNFDALPGRAYVIGFARSYAQYLGLDSKTAVERIKAEIAGRGEMRDGVIQVAPPRERRLPQGGIVFAVLLAIAVIYGIYYLTGAVSRLTSQPVPPVPPQLAAQAELAPAAPAKPASAREAAAPAETISPPAPPQAEAAAPPPEPATEPLPQGTRYGTQNAGSRITLLAHKPARVTVLGVDKRLFLDRNLQAGDSYVVPNATGLTLSTTDAGALELILDGKTAGYAGTNGTPADSLSLNPQDVARQTQH